MRVDQGLSAEGCYEKMAPGCPVCTTLPYPGLLSGAYAQGGLQAGETVGPGPPIF